jgi:hypothetical protein
MARFVRTLLIWLMVLAIPAQGLAAATRAFCGPNYHSGGSARAEASETVSSHSHHGAAPSVHESDSSGATAEAIAGEAPDTSKSGSGTKQKCSACASCCSVGAIPTSWPHVPATDAAPTVFTAVVPTVDAFAAGGPDRPPRHVLA